MQVLLIAPGQALRQISARASAGLLRTAVLRNLIWLSVNTLSTFSTSIPRALNQRKALAKKTVVERRVSTYGSRMVSSTAK
jgi:hypothetical protein